VLSAVVFGAVVLSVVVLSVVVRLRQSAVRCLGGTDGTDDVIWGGRSPPQAAARDDAAADGAEDKQADRAEDGGAERTTKRARDSKTIGPLAIVLLVRHGEDDAVTTQTRTGQGGQTRGRTRKRKLES